MHSEKEQKYLKAWYKFEYQAKMYIYHKDQAPVG